MNPLMGAERKVEKKKRQDKVTCDFTPEPIT